eukprot:713985-Pyramimonas_sp.AAC.3
MRRCSSLDSPRGNILISLVCAIMVVAGTFNSAREASHLQLVTHAAIEDGYCLLLHGVPSQVQCMQQDAAGCSTSY